MANPLQRLAKSGVSALLGSLLLAAMAATASSATVVGEFYSDDATSTGATCGSSTCTVVFAFLPTGKALAITSVACKFSVAGTGALSEMRLYTLGQAGPYGTFLKPVLLGTVDSIRSYQTNDALLHLIPVGSRAGVVFAVPFATAGQLGPMRCHIAGVLRP